MSVYSLAHIRCFFDDEKIIEVQVSYDDISYNDTVIILKERTGWDEIDFRIRQYMPSDYHLYGATICNVSTLVSNKITRMGCYLRHMKTGELYGLMVGHTCSEDDSIETAGQRIGRCVEVVTEKEPKSVDLAIIKLTKEYSKKVSSSINSPPLRFPVSEDEVQERLLYRCEAGPVEQLVVAVGQKSLPVSRKPAYFRHSYFTDKAHGIHGARTCVRLAPDCPVMTEGDCGGLLLTAPPLAKRTDPSCLMVLGNLVGCLTQEAEDGGDAHEYYIAYQLQNALAQSKTFAGQNYDFFYNSAKYGYT